MKMKDIRRANYDIFDDCESSSRRKELVSAMSYIDQLGAISGNDISHWRVLEIFKNPRSEKEFIHSDKNRINELFFEELKRIADGAPVKVKMNDRTREAFENIFIEIEGREKNRLVEMIRNKQSQSTTKYNEYIQCLRDAISANQRLVGLKNNHQDLVRQVDEILATDFWSQDIGMQNYEYLEFKTMPVVLTYVNSAQAANITVPVGRFIVRVYIGHDAPFVSVLPYDHSYMDAADKNIFLGSDRKFYHPHVNVNGAPCLGNMLNDYNKAMIDRDYVKVLWFIHSTLTKYNDGNPFVHLHSFRDELARKLENEKKKKAKTAEGPTVGSTVVINDEAARVDMARIAEELRRQQNALGSDRLNISGPAPEQAYTAGGIAPLTVDAIRRAAERSAERAGQPTMRYVSPDDARAQQRVYGIFPDQAPNSPTPPPTGPPPQETTQQGPSPQANPNIPF